MAKTAQKPAAPESVAATEITLIPLRSLQLSIQNTRTVQPTAIRELAENIAGSRLLHNLIVVPTDPGGPMAVVDGGRRLEALQLLESEGRITGDYLVPVQVVTDSEACALSLAANHQREPLHPVDEARAFAELVSQRRTKAAIALLFGVSKRYVEQRLKLAAVHPEILSACAVGDIDMETLQAFTVCDDRGRQFDVFVEMREGLKEEDLGPYDVREALLTEAMEDDHRLVKFIGIDAYREAGGKFLTDLFSDDDAPTLIADSALVRKLAEKKLKKAAKDVTGWAWVQTITDNYPNREQFDRVSPVGDEFTPEELAIVGAFVAVNMVGEAYTLDGFIRNKDSAAFETLQDEIYAAKNNPPAPGPDEELPDDDREEPAAQFPSSTMPTAPRGATLNVADVRAMIDGVCGVIHWIEDGCAVEEVDETVQWLRTIKQNLDALLLGA